MNTDNPSPNASGCSATWRNDHGRDLLVLENNCVSIEAWPAMGGAVLSFTHLERNLDVLWHNPLLKTHTNSLYPQPATERTDLYDTLDGSWFVSLPTGFFPTHYFGAPIGAHGEMRAVPWEVENIEHTPDKVEVRLSGDSIRTPFRMERKWTLHRDSSVLDWEETVINRSGKSRPLFWLHHPTFGGPLIEGARLVADCENVGVYEGFSPEDSQVLPGYNGSWPWVEETQKGGGKRDCSIVPPRGAGVEHSIVLSGFNRGWGCVWNPEMQLGFGLRWDEQHFPCAWSWMDSGGLEDYPMWGQGHLVTLQPGTSPIGTLEDLIEQDALLTVPPYGSMTTAFRSGYVQDPDQPLDLQPPTGRAS